MRIHGVDVSSVGADARSWWRPRRILLASAIAVCIATAAFVYRFNSLGGTFAGFENDHFAHLMRTEMLLHGEQPLRDFQEAELRGAWPSLGYAVPAWAQQLGGRTLLPEAYLTIGALALAYAIVFLLALDLSRRWSVAVLAAVVAAAAAPKLYNYSKVLLLAIGALAVLALRTPSFARLLLAAAVTAIATLFRHDYGVYVAVAALVALAAGPARPWAAAGRRCLAYLAMTTVLLLPSAVWVQMYEGIPTYVANALRSSAVEARRTPLRLSSFEIAEPLTTESLITLTYVAFWGIVLVAAVSAVWRTLHRQAADTDAGERVTTAALLALAIVAIVFLLRANLTQRFGDAVVPVVLLAAWTTGFTRTASPAALRALGTAAPVVLLLLILAGTYAFGDVARQLETSGLTVSWHRVQERFAAVRMDLLSLPPRHWSALQAEGSLVAARYVAECTAPDDYLFLAGYAPDVPVMAQRRFAAGQGTTSLSFYTSREHQEQALARLRKQSVPIVLADAATFDEEFAVDYPLIAEYLTARYREAGTIPAGDERRFRVFVDAGRTVVRAEPHFGLPCFR